MNSLPDIFSSVAEVVSSPSVLLTIVAGVLWGMVAGALPGINSVIAMAIALPFTFELDTSSAVMCLIAVNVGVAYGNSIPAILIGIPGTPAAILTAMDGHKLHKCGKGGLALGVTYIASVFGQFIGTFLFLAMVVPLSTLTYVFLSPELFALYFLGIITVVSLTSRNILKGLISMAFGLVVATIGRDPLSAVVRFDFDIWALREGLDPIPVVLGLLALSEIFCSMRQAYSSGMLAAHVSPKFPHLKEIRPVLPSILGGTIIGSVIGAIPGVGGTVAAIIAYQQSRMWSKHRENYGHGSLSGIAANESAQNASQAGEMVPTLGLGIPSGGTMVLLLSSLMIHGLVPGPLLINERPDLLYAAVTGLLVATLMLAIVGWFVARLFFRIVMLDYSAILCGSLLLTMVGAYTVNHSQFDVIVLVVFGMIGYVMHRYGYSVAGATIGMILGGGLEVHLRAGLLLVGDVWSFVTRPWTAVILTVAALLLFQGILRTLKQRGSSLNRAGIA